MKDNCNKENCILNIDEVFVNGSFWETGLLKKYLLSFGLREYKCEICGLSKWNNQDILLECHHIDGNRFNNELNNLQLLCLNCHAQTENFRGKNINGNREQYIDDNKFIEAIKKNTSIRRALIELNLAPKGGNYDRAKKLIKQYNIKLNKKIIIPDVKKSKVIHQEYCSDCGKELNGSVSGLCRTCLNKKNTNPNKPSKEILEQEIKEHSFLSLGKKYGVSDSAIRKWCKNYGIDYKCGIRKESLQGLKKGRETQSYQSKLKQTCPRCGKRKHQDSELCRTCWLEEKLKKKQEKYSN